MQGRATITAGHVRCDIDRRMATATWRAGTTVRVRGRRWRVEGVTEGDDCAALRLRDVDGGNTPTLTILTPFDRPISLERRPSLRVVRRRRCLHEIDRAILDAHAFGSLTQLARANVRVMPYQLEPALAMLRRGATRMLIADGVGLGKTIQAGIILLELTAASESCRALVLTPAGLREQWRGELASHFNLASELADSEWLRRVAMDRPPDVNPWSLPGIYVASHDFIKRPEALRAIENVDWDIVIVDEAHAASSATDRRAAIHGVARRALRVILLTATPHDGDPREFAALCDIGRINARESPPAYFARCKDDVQPGEARRMRIHAVASTSCEAAMHRALERYSDCVWREATARGDERARLASIVLRKRALSSSGSLLMSLQRRLDLLRGVVDPGAHQLLLPLDDEDPLEDGEPPDVLAAPGLTDPNRERRWLSSILDIARTAAADERKARWLIRLLRRIDEPVIIFTEYRDTLITLERALTATGRMIAVLHGGMDPRERALVSSSLSDRTKILLATDAAAEGLNLHHYARIVIHYELPWNPDRLEQRAGRVDRIGQTRRVHEIALVSPTRAERLVLEPIARRSAPRVRTSLTIVDAFRESHIVEAVMSGLPISFTRQAVEPTSAPALDVLDLREEAAIEAADVERQRTLRLRSGATLRRPRHGGPIACAFRSRALGADERLHVVYRIDIVDEAGRTVHQELVTVSVQATSPKRLRSPRELRAHLVNAIENNEGLKACVGDKTRTLLTRIELDTGVLAHRLHDRRTAIDYSSISPSRGIVQLRFFGSRRRQEPERIAIAPRSRMDQTLAASSSLVAAVLRVGR